jgi:myo-inositol catabolism protein IolS
MQYRRIGRTDVRVSSVCMGCWAIADPRSWGPQDKSDTMAAVAASLDAGVNFFDTAENYGDGYSEELLGRALGRHRSEAIIGTKARRADHAADALVAACERSLRRLNTDYIDLYMLHWPNHAVPFAETMSAMHRLVASGKVRYAGVSNFAKLDLPELLACGRAEVDQLPYSLLWRAIEDEVLPICRDNEVSVTCYCPIMQGLLSGRWSSADDVPPERARTRHFAGSRPNARHGQAGAEAETFAAVARIKEIAARAATDMSQVALAWLLAQPGVTSVVVGARNAAQAKTNAAAGDLALSADVLAELSAATDSLKHIFGPDNPDMWQVPGRMR